MLCTRCSHPLASRADRCLRCFALNPQNIPPPVARVAAAAPRAATVAALASMSIDSDPPARALGSIASDPPVAVTASFRSEPPLSLRASIDSEPPVASSAISSQALAALAASFEPAPPVAATVSFPTEPAPAPRSPERTAARTAPIRPEPTASVPHLDPHEALTDPPDPTDAQSLNLQGLQQSAGSVEDFDFTSVVPPTDDVVSTPEDLEGQDLKDCAPPAGPPLRARLLAWSVDLALLLSCAAAHVWLATSVIGPARLAPRGTGSPDYWLDLLLAPSLPFLWAALAACLAFAYSWLFAALGGRTPGMALAHLKLVTADGESLTPAQALTRAALSLASAAGLLGFALALFDERGQTLHDKLTRTLVVPETPPLR
jgi:uncharacterized RDD family membrane protein YckC